MSSTNSKPVLWALVDCESFYSSCERIFRPDLTGRPIVVLSNNDGCLVALSPEAKALGFKMGEPYFSVERALNKAGVTVFSSNYTLYADMSRRVMATMATVVPTIEQYSIDEAFIPLPPALAAQAEDVGRTIHDRVRQWTGIPVRVGIGPTKTLAKLANHWAKKGGRVLVFEIGSRQLEDILEKTPVGDVWGIGRRSRARLEEIGIIKARQLRDLEEGTSRKLFSVVGRRTIQELRGRQCIEDDPAPVRQSLFNSRSFGRPVADKEELLEALSYHCGIAGERLRAEGLTAGSLSIHLATSWFGEQPFQTGSTIEFGRFTGDTRIFMRAAKEALGRCFRSGIKYAKAGVLLQDIGPAQRQSISLFDEISEPEAQGGLMLALDEINRKFGKNTIRLGAQGEPDATWHMKRNMKSRNYTTDWGELAEVK